MGVGVGIHGQMNDGQVGQSNSSGLMTERCRQKTEVLSPWKS